jgi:hypothetical protein
MLTYAVSNGLRRTICAALLKGASTTAEFGVVVAGGERRMLTYADVCCRMLPCVDVC